MSERPNFALLPYSYVVRQRTLCRLLEVAYVMGTSVGGVLVSGERGTAKSTIVRSFAYMMYEKKLPVTLPINATDDRVMGGWQIKALMEGKSTWQNGLLKQANDAGMLYIDEVNLLDDHITNLILDVVSTRILTIEREGVDEQDDVSFMLVGTMNPEEGALRPQLLDRFGLFVSVEAERAAEVRRDILATVLQFDTERDQEHSEWLAEGRALDARRRDDVERARDQAPSVELTDATIDLCARVAAAFEVVGHRAEIVMAEGARAVAALADRQATIPLDVSDIAPHAIVHRRRDVADADGFEWSAKDAERLARVLAEA